MILIKHLISIDFSAANGDAVFIECTNCSDYITFIRRLLPLDNYKMVEILACCTTKHFATNFDFLSLFLDHGFSICTLKCEK